MSNDSEQGRTSRLGTPRSDAPAAPGRGTTTSRMPPSARAIARALATELRGAPPAPTEDTRATRGLAGTAGSVPYASEMERAFGQSFGDVKAHSGAEATAACNDLGAVAYTYGSSVAFADAAPARDVVAHELAHVVQQRGGTPTVARRARDEAPAGDLEAEADRAAAQVAAGGSVTTPLTGSGQRVSFLRRYGQVAWRHNDERLTATTPELGEGQHTDLFARTVDEWNQFIAAFSESHLDDLQVHCFLMAKERHLGQALPRETYSSEPGQPHDPRRISTTFFRYTIDDLSGEPTDEDCVALARSVLHTGANLSVLARSAPELAASFLQRYTGDAIDARSRGMHAMGREDVNHAQEFGEANSSHQANNDAVIGSSLGASFRAATEYLNALATSSAPGASQQPQYERITRLRNGALTMRGVLAGLANVERSDAAAMHTAFSVTMGTLGSALGEVASLILEPLTEIASQFFEGLGQGTVAERLQDLRTRFDNELIMFGAQHNLPPNEVLACTNTFDNALDSVPSQ